MASGSDEIIYQFYDVFRVYKDGRMERLAGRDVVPASIDPDTEVLSKDIEIDPHQDVSARLYLPRKATPPHKLPLLVYFHGGGFAIESACSPTYHNFLNELVEQANVVAVSVNYRLAPEYPLPVAYEDSWHALKWVASQSHEDADEPWLKEYADFDRVYLGGDSAGGNIAHNTAMRASFETLDGANIVGMFLNCPYFGGKEPIGNESEPANIHRKGCTDGLWRFAYPTSSGLDDPVFNPAMDAKLSSLGCKRVLVYVGEKDILKDRAWYYKETLSKSGWVGDVEVVEVEGEDHVFDLSYPTSDKAISIMKKVAYFLNNGKP